MTDENLTSKETLSDDVDVASSDGKEETVDSPESLSLEELNEHLGKEFPTKEAALKSMKDTFNYVGKAGQAEKKLKELEEQRDSASSSEEKDALETRIKQLEEETFYSKHPEYEPYKGLINRLGGNPSEVVELEEFKSVFDKAKAQDEAQSVKSVLHSSPRLGKVRDKITEAREDVQKAKEAEKSGDVTGAVEAKSRADRNAVGSVIEAYEL